MHELICGPCSGGGLIRPGALCPHCEGAGYLRRLTLSIPVVSRCEALPSDGPCWVRLAVMSTEIRGKRAVARGISDEGRPATAILAAHALAEARKIVFSEVGSWQ